MGGYLVSVIIHDHVYITIGTLRSLTVFEISRTALRIEALPFFLSADMKIGVSSNRDLIV